MARQFEADFLPNRLELDRCPRCNVRTPHLTCSQEFGTETDAHQNPRAWGIYICQSCAGVVVVRQPLLAIQHAYIVNPGMAPKVLPEGRKVSTDVPIRAAKYLFQALESIAAPDAAVMVAGSAIDAMLKEIGLKDGSVHRRIGEARGKGLITQGMADWANEVRVAANEQRHSDENFAHATTEDAERLVEFALAFAEFLFVLPARVARGRKPKDKPEGE